MIRSVFATALLLAAGQVAVVSADIRAILQEFYQATGGATWTNNYGWAENLDNLCEWRGVICAGDTSELDLAEEVVLPPSTTDPKAVIGIRLRQNFLTGRVNQAIWTLPDLIYLDVSFNAGLEVSFVGLGESKTIQAIVLHDTATSSLTGIAAAAATLRSFHVSGVPLETPIPDEIFSLVNLQYLHMSQTALQGPIPETLAKLSNLRDLNLAENLLTGSLPAALTGIPELRVLALSKNKLSGELPSALNNLVHLHELYADQNQFSGNMPSLSAQQNLYLIYLQNNQLTGPIPEDFLAGTAVTGWNQTYRIDLSNNMLTQIPKSLDAFQGFPVYLNLANNHFSMLPTVLCDNYLWNNGTVAQYKCDGLLCPVGTYSPYGYAKTETCQVCSAGTYLGSTLCLDRDDLSILQTLLTSTKEGGAWKSARGWVESGDGDYCKWQGITCDANGRVIKILLPNNGLQGTVPETIFFLEFLTEMDLSRNDIKLPFRMADLAHQLTSLNIAYTKTSDFSDFDKFYVNRALQYFYADGIPLDGPFPTEIPMVHSLRVLSLSESLIKGELPSGIGSFGRLEELYLHDNELRGTIPMTIGQLQNLKIVSLAKNQLTGTLPKEITRMPQLQALSLTDQVTKGGGLTGKVPSFSESTQLTTLLLSDNMFNGTIPETLLRRVDLNALITVQLSNNQLTGSVPGVLAIFDRMNLYVDGNQLTSVDPRLCLLDNWMSGAVKQYSCDAILCPANAMGGRQMYTNEPCEPCGNETNTTLMGQYECEVTLSSSNSSSSSTEEGPVLSEQQILELVYRNMGGIGWHMQDNWMSEASICVWHGVICDASGHVKAMSLGSNQLLGKFPTEIYQLPQLEKLVLYSNDIIFSFDGIEKAANLKTLVLDSTELFSLRGLGNAVALQELNVRYNKLSGEMPEDISRLTLLKSLDISNNDLTGEIPAWMSSLTQLQTFKAANNKLSGPLYDFSSLRDLSYIDLSNNLIEGDIPPTMLQQSNTNQKIVVALNNNRLSGTVPAQLGMFGKLSIHLSDNEITGLGDGLCSVGGWNDYGVSIYGCDGILCPVGTGNALGRQTSEDNPCVPCREATYMGSTQCTKKSSARRPQQATTGLIVVIAAILAFVG